MRQIEVKLVKGSISNKDYESLNRDINYEIRQIMSGDRSTNRINISIDEISISAYEPSQAIAMIQYSFDVVNTSNSQKDIQYVYTPAHYPDYASSKEYVDYTNTSTPTKSYT